MSTPHSGPPPVGWTEQDGSLVAEFDTGSFTAGLQFVNAIGDAAEAAGHHPDVLLTYPSVRISLTTHDAGMITGKDFGLAEEISQIAADQGIERA